MLRVGASLHTEHQRHGHWSCQPGLCTYEQREGQERVKGNSEISAGKRVTIVYFSA